MSYKPQRKYIAEIKELTNTYWFQTGANWFTGYEPNEVSGDQPSSFEILRNDFVITFENPAGSAWKYSGSLRQSGIYHFKYDAIIDVADNTESNRMGVRTFHSFAGVDGYTPSPGADYTTFAAREDVIRQYVDTTIGSNDCRSVHLEFTLEYDSTVTSAYNGLAAQWTSGTNTKHVTEWLYQRIEITKL